MLTKNLKDAALDWAVCKACGLFKSYPYTAANFLHIWKTHRQTYTYLHPSTDDAQGSDIIEREKIGVEYIRDGLWEATWWDGAHLSTVISKTGPTHIIAAMRCYVTMKLGPEIEIPKELL